MGLFGQLQLGVDESYSLLVPTKYGKSIDGEATIEVEQDNLVVPSVMKLRLLVYELNCARSDNNKKKKELLWLVGLWYCCMQWPRNYQNCINWGCWLFDSSASFIQCFRNSLANSSPCSSGINLFLSFFSPVATISEVLVNCISNSFM